jgi:hypothetical protein
LALFSGIYGPNYRVSLLIKTERNLKTIKKKENIEFLHYSYRDAGNFLSVTKNWRPGDKLTLQLPISLRTEAIQGIFM